MHYAYELAYNLDESGRPDVQKGQSGVSAIDTDIHEDTTDTRRHYRRCLRASYPRARRRLSTCAPSFRTSSDAPGSWDNIAIS